MKILALVGSPRKRSNTDLLVDQFLEGGKEGKHTGEKLYLYDFEILPCVDCRACKRGDFVCPLNDGMRKIYPKMEKADLDPFRNTELLVWPYREDEASDRSNEALRCK